MNMEKMKEVFSDEAFVKSLLAMETAAEVQAALQEKGVELTEEEILSVRALLTKAESGEITAEQLEIWQQQAEDGELSDEALEHVSGGFAISIGVIVNIVIAIAATAGSAYAADHVIMEETGRHW